MELSKRKRFYFRLFALSLPFLFFLIFELIFRLAGVGRAPLHDPYILLYSPSSIFKRVQVEGQVMLRVYREDLYSNRNIQIAEKKPKGVFRIFCVGGSASAGWPHQEEHAYSSYLEEALKQCFPQKTFEVHNLSGHAFGSNRVRLIFDELLNLEPDLMILYSGNNEFLEERFYKKPTAFSQKKHQIGSFLRLSRVYSWVEGKILKKIEPKDAFSANRKEKNRESIASKIFQQELELRKNPEQFSRLLEHYQFNIEEMVKSAKAKNVQTLILTVPVNLREWKPNVSSHQEGFKELEGWTLLYRQARRLLFEKKYTEALPVLEALREKDPNYAESYFWLGTCQYALKNYEEAKKAFIQATDLDFNPFRALTQTNAILRKVAKQEQVECVDLVQIFAEKTKGCPGYDLFLDYVHPTAIGNVIIARSVFQKVLEQNWCGTPEKELPEAFVSSLARYREEEDQGVQHSVIFLCGMMHQYQKMVEVSQLFLPIARDLAKEFTQDVLEIFPLYLEIEKKEIYDTPVPEKEELLKKIQDFYQKYYFGNKR